MSSNSPQQPDPDRDRLRDVVDFIASPAGLITAGCIGLLVLIALGFSIVGNL